MNRFFSSAAVVFFLIFATCAATPAADQAAAGAAFAARIKAAAAVPAAPIPSGITRDNVTGSVVLIGSDESRGTGFLCRLWGVPVIVTNAHVFAQQFDSRIEDGQQHVYPVKAALVSKKRDLAIIETDIPADRKVFELAPDVAGLAIDSAATAYGDSLGDRVITMLPGKLLGIGPDEIEISAGIVPGNSGGPVVDADFNIIGMSTYLKVLNREANLLDGTRFGDGKESNAGVRRFAIRLDRLDPEEFEIFDPAQQKADLETFRRIARANSDFLNEMRAHKGVAIWVNFYQKYARIDPGWGYQASISFLDRMLKEEQTRTALLSAIFGIAPVRLSPAEIKQADAMFRTLERTRRERFKCATCSGRGYELEIGRNSREAVRCPDCLGLGEADFPYYYIRVSPISSMVRFSPLRAGRVAPGMDTALVYKQLEVKKEEIDSRNVNGIFNICSIKGSPGFPSAKKTYLTFVAQRLSMISIHFDRNRETWNDLKNMLIKTYGQPLADYGDGANFGYVLFAKPGGTLTLSLLSFSNELGGIRLTARHSTLTNLEFRFLQSLGNQLFVPPDTKAKEPRGFFM